VYKHVKLKLTDSTKEKIMFWNSRIHYYVSTVKQTGNVLYKTEKISGCIKGRRQKENDYRGQNQNSW